MKSKLKTLLILGAFLAQFYVVAPLRAEISAGNSTQESYRSVSLPQKDRLALVSVVQVTVGGLILGGLAAYDDTATPRPADYLELYNTSGELLAVTWFDRFGIERLAVDRALAEHADRLEGVFVLVENGDSI
jgi:hypothetical protein